MASYNFLLTAFLAVSAQIIDARSLKDCGDINSCFHEAVRNMDANLNKVVIEIIDVLEPKYQLIRLTAKNALAQGIQELDAVENGALAEVEDFKNQAEGNINHCLKDEIEIKLLTEDARKTTSRCVDSTQDSIDSIFDIGVLELYHLRKIIDELVLEFSMCIDEDCQQNVFNKVVVEEERVIIDAQKIANLTGENMENSIPGIEDRCMSAHRQALRIKLRDIVDDIERCIQNNQ